MHTRRDFLAGIASTSLAAALPMHLSEAERRTAVRPVTDTWDMSWVDRLRGRSRAVFDSPEPAEGAALYLAWMWREQHVAVFGTPRSEVTPVVVIRHAAIPLVMDDAHWDHIGVGKDLKIKDPSTKKWARKNPIASAPPDMPPDMKDISVPNFIATGGIVLGCNLAFQGIVAQYKDKDKLSQAEADKAARSHLIPGVILQPSGFFAVLKAQDEGCKFMFVTA